MHIQCIRVKVLASFAKLRRLLVVAPIQTTVPVNQRDTDNANKNICHHTYAAFTWNQAHGRWQTGCSLSG